MNNKCYVTVLTTSKYLPGVLALNENLKAVGAIYPLVCLCDDTYLLDEVYNTLEKARINYIIQKPEYTINPNVILANNIAKNVNWTFTFFKVYMLGVPYDKIVFLDADVIVLDNVDELFDKPHLTACKDQELFPPEMFEGYLGFNSGVMVIEPNKDMLNKAIDYINRWKDRGGDQQIFEKLYPDWNNHPELKLSKYFNVFLYRWFVDYTLKNVSFNGNNRIRIAHFVGDKPWEGTWAKEITEHTILTPTFYKLKICINKYLNYEQKIKEFLRNN